MESITRCYICDIIVEKNELHHHELNCFLTTLEELENYDEMTIGEEIEQKEKQSLSQKFEFYSLDNIGFIGQTYNEEKDELHHRELNFSLTTLEELEKYDEMTIEQEEEREKQSLNQKFKFYSLDNIGFIGHTYDEEKNKLTKSWI